MDALTTDNMVCCSLSFLLFALSLSHSLFPLSLLFQRAQTIQLYIQYC